MDLFPAGIAEGEAFCNRTSERKLLSEYIMDRTHTVIVAPRRYGKSSLIQKVADDNKVVYSWTDFLTVSSKKEVEMKIGKAVAQLLYQLAPDLKKLQINFQKFFKSMSPDLIIQALGASVSIHPNFEKSVEIDEALKGLDAYAQELGKKVVIVFDEFQEISMIKDHKVIEALIRHAVERSKAITYIFSGSNRHLLVSMFSSKDRPLYRLCQTMTLERIQEKDYKDFLDAVAIKQWGKTLPKKAFKKIMELTERHSYYVNGLCKNLWRLKALPKEDQVTEVWNEYVNANRTSIVSDIFNLSLNQKRIVATLAKTPASEVFGKDFSVQSNLSVSSIKQAIEVLISKDIICQDEQKLYRLLDPAVRHYLLMH